MIEKVTLRFWVFAALLLPSISQASILCDYYHDHEPELYKVTCTNGSASSKPAGANSTFADAFNLNSASLPTEPSSYGLETLVSALRKHPGTWAPTFSLIKGFHRFGTGISTSSNNTFYGNDVVQRGTGFPEVSSFEPNERARGSLTNFNIGSSLTLLEPTHGPAVRLGISVRYNKITDTWGGGPALLLNWERFTLGAGYTHERVSNFLPWVQFTNLTLSARHSILELEYSELSSLGGFVLSPIHILSLTASWRHITLTAAVRNLSYLKVGEVTQTHYAVQYLFSKWFSAGFLINYIPGANTLGTQWFL